MHATAGTTVRRASAVLGAAVLAVAGLTLVMAPNALAAPKLTISDSTVHAGQTVTVKGSGFPNKPTSLYITICGNPPGATNCDVDLSHVTQVQYDGSGSFSTKYKIAVTKFSSAAGTIDCAKKQCVIGSTNALDPKDHSYNAVALFTVASSSPTPTATKSSSSSTPASGGSTPASTGASTLPKTGASSSTPLLAGAGVAALLAGSVLVLAVFRRRGQHVR